MCSCLTGVSMWFTPLACGAGCPELSKSYMDMASKLFTFTFTYTESCGLGCAALWLGVRHAACLQGPCRKRQILAH